MRLQHPHFRPGRLGERETRAASVPFPPAPARAARSRRAGGEDYHDGALRGVQVRKRAGMRHHPLAGILNGFAAAGLVIERVAGSGSQPVLITLAVRACKPS